MTYDMNHNDRKRDNGRRDTESTAHRRHTTCGLLLRTLLLLIAMMAAGVTEAWGADYSGTYYIANKIWNGDHDANNEPEHEYYLYNINTPDKNWYLVPARNPHQANKEDAFYSNDSYATSGDPAKPFLTTYRTNRDNNSIWVITKTGDKYLIKHFLTGKYLKYEPPVSGKPNRRSVHLEAVEGDTPPTGNEFLFTITTKTENSISGYSIKPTQANGTVVNGFLNPAGDNWPYYFSHITNKESIWCTGIVGYWTSEGGGSLWIFEKVADYKYKPDFSLNTDNQIVITYLDNYDAIYYTTDGSEPPTSGEEHKYTVPFNPPANATSIQAVAVKDGVASPVATYSLPFFPGSTHKYIFQSKSCQFYNMIPNLSVDANTKNVSALNVPSTTMAWHFEYAADEDGQYYYIVSETENSEKWYMYYNTSNTDKHIYLKKTKDDSDNYKFNIDANPSGGYNLIPKGQAKAIYKNIFGNNNAGLKPVMFDGNIADAVSRWDIIPYSAANLPQWDDQPFTESTNNDTKYYNIVSVSQPTCPLVLNNDGLIKSETIPPTGYDERKAMWVIKNVDSDADGLLDFYTFQNAYTGDFLYYNGAGKEIKENTGPGVLQMGKPTSEGALDSWSYFAVVQTLNGYNIIPSVLVDKTKAISTGANPEGFNCINRANGSDVTGAWYDNDDGSRWTFEEQTNVKCMNPVFTEEANGDITITTVTNAAKILCTIDDVNNPTASSNEYTTILNTSTQRVIKAIAIIGDDPNTASDVVTLLNKPDITVSPVTYTGTALPAIGDISEVSIGDAPNKTTAPGGTYEIDYANCANNINVGTATLTLNDANASDLWYIWNASTTFTISPASVTVTAVDKTKEYGDNDPELTATVEGMQNGESATELIHYTISRVAGENVGGTYAITPSGQATQGNYSVTYVPGELTITRKAVTVTADDIEKTYGDADPTLSATIAGLLNGDSESVISYTISRAEGENVGSYVITPTGATDQGNYTVTYPTGTLTINKKSLTVTANNKSITYGDTPANNGVTYGTFAPNEDENDLVGNLTYTYNYAQYDDVGSGSFAITPSGLTSDNYELTFVPGTLTVERKEVGIGGWSNTTVIYNGSAQAPTATVDTNDLINGDEGVEVTVTVTGGGINAGSYTATASGLTGSKAGNYKLPNPAPTSPFTINKAQLMAVTLGNNALTYNGTEQTVTITSVTAGDGTVVTVSDVPSEDYDVSGNSATNANTYTVTVTPKSPSTNYETGVSVSESYTIGQKSIGDGTDPATANGITINITWNDDELDPYIVEVKDGETLLTKGTDYAFSPSPTGGHDTKYYTVTIAGTNNYKDQFTSQYANVKFDSNGSDGAMYYGTFVADGNHATPEDMTPYIITSVADNTATALALDYIPTGVPIVLMNPTYAKGFLVQSGTGEISTTGNLLEVQATNEEKATAFAYLLYKGEFVLNKAGTFKAGTVYLPVPAGGVSPARLKIIEDDIEGDNTGIENIEKTIDSQSGAWYTLDGRSLSSKPTKKGIYLQSGKKIVVK